MVCFGIFQHIVLVLQPATFLVWFGHISLLANVVLRGSSSSSRAPNDRQSVRDKLNVVVLRSWGRTCSNFFSICLCKCLFCALIFGITLKVKYFLGFLCWRSRTHPSKNPIITKISHWIIFTSMAAVAEAPSTDVNTSHPHCLLHCAAHKRA